jgi:hypothetical protein
LSANVSACEYNIKSTKKRKEVDEMCKMLEYFKEMKDYRQSWKVRHLLEDIIVIIICGVVSGAENIAEIGLGTVQD